MQIGEYISSRTRAAAAERAAAREEIAARKAVVGEICGDPEMDADGAATFRAAVDLAAQELCDEKAVEAQCLYPVFADDTAYSAGDRLVYDGKLYKVLQAHTSQGTWLPGTGTESLYARIDEQHDGTKYDPIPYSGNMTLEAGKYYSQSGKTYLCNRDTGNLVYNALADLVGIYVMEV